MKIVLAAVYTKFILFLLIIDSEQGNPMFRVIKDPSSLDIMRETRDFMDYEDLNGQVRGYTVLTGDTPLLNFHIPPTPSCIIDQTPNR